MDAQTMHLRPAHCERRSSLNFQDTAKRAVAEVPADPIRHFTAPKLTRKENVVKRAIEAYHVSDVDNTEVIYFGRKAHSVFQSLDLPDATCDGLIYKQRLVQTKGGDCLLIARWKPDRYMRRSAPEQSQRWFIEKELFPPDLTRFFSRLERAQQEAADHPEQAATEEAVE
jgi:hypothetical protein